MKYARALSLVGCMLSAVGACTSDLALSLEDKVCNADDRCLPDYRCNVQTRLCEPRERLPVGGGGTGGRGGSSGGIGAAPGNGGAGIGEGGDSGGGRYGNGGTDGGGGSTTAAGAGGTAPRDLDAGSDAGADGGCVPTMVYRDDDGDRVGDTADSQVACPGPGWVTVAGDCRDDIQEVHPGQTDYFAVPYVEQPSPGGVSFDYDCDDVESPDDDNLTLDAAPDCAGLLSCTGRGFLPADPPRSGDGSDPRCGSNLLRTCSEEGLLACNNDDTPTADQIRFRCR